MFLYSFFILFILPYSASETATFKKRAVYLPTYNEYIRIEFISSEKKRGKKLRNVVEKTKTHTLIHRALIKIYTHFVLHIHAEKKRKKIKNIFSM